MAWLIDTNVVSELRKGDRGATGVRDWYLSASRDDLYISVLVLGELRRGVESIRARDVPSAKVLEHWLREVEGVFMRRVLPVTAEIADLWGRLSLKDRLPDIDGLLAATALHHDLTLVTRNTRDMARSGAVCFDPFLDRLP